MVAGDDLRDCMRQDFVVRRLGRGRSDLRKKSSSYVRRPARLLRMARFILFWVLVVGVLPMGVSSVDAASRKILKVLPQYLDQEGRHTLSPSLYERDAYQLKLRENPRLRSGMRFMISWRAPEVEGFRLRVEIRGSKDNVPTKLTLEQEARNHHGGREWTELRLTGDKYASLGEMLSWRATLWKGEELLSEDKSFLW